MSQVLITESYITDIARAIRSKNGQSASYYPSEMAAAISSIHSAGEFVTVSQTFSANGSYLPSSYSADAFSGVTVDVPNSYSSADEGKVVHSGALETQGVMSVSENSVYDTTLFSQVSVAIPSATLISKTISENGTYNPVDDNADAYSQVVVDVSGGGGGVDAKAITREAGSFYDSIVSTIGTSAFGYYAGLSAIEMTSVETIGLNAFISCSALSYASFPKCSNVLSYAFRYCSSLKEIHLSSVFCLSVFAFEGCKKLSIIDLENIQSIPTGAFLNCGLISVDMPNCTIIQNNAFISCSLMESISLSVCTAIGSSAFSGCVKLKDVYVPVLNCVEQKMFSDCGSLNTISLPVCNKLSDSAFYNCKKLESIYLLSTSIVTLIANAFTNTPISKSTYLGYYGSVFVPSSLVDSYKTANAWSIYSDRITAYTE